MARARATSSAVKPSSPRFSASSPATRTISSFLRACRADLRRRRSSSAFSMLTRAFDHVWFSEYIQKTDDTQKQGGDNDGCEYAGDREERGSERDRWHRVPLGQLTVRLQGRDGRRAQGRAP